MGTGPFKFVEWKATDYLKVAKFDGYWRKGYPKVDTITWKPVVDNNSRAALMQTGEAHFTFPVPYELADVLKAKPDLEVVAAPSIVLRYLSMNTQQKPFDNPKVRQAIAYAINKEALAKVAFNGYAAPAEGVAPQGVEYAVKIGAVAVRRRQGEAAADRGRLPERLRDRAVVGATTTARRKRSRSSCSSSSSRSASRRKITLLEAGQRVEKVESWQDPADRAGAALLRRMVDVDRRGRLGAAPAALRRIVAAAAVQHRVLQEREGRRRHQGRAAHDRLGTEKAKLYKDAQETICKDAPWAPLVTEKLLSAHNKKLSGVYVIPDASFNFTEIDLK